MKLFVLLGAGASIPYFPGTAQVTTELRKWDMYREPPPTGADQGSDCLRLMLNGRVTNGTLHWIKRDEVQKVQGETADILLSFRGGETTFKEHSLEIFDFLAPKKKSWSLRSWLSK